jgi:hypothetical protein
MKLHIPRELDKELKKEKSLIDNLALLAGVAGPLATIPQAISVWTIGSEGVSVLTWVLFLAVSNIFLVYSVLYRLKSLFISSVIWIIMETIILLGIYLG